MGRAIVQGIIVVFLYFLGTLVVGLALSPALALFFHLLQVTCQWADFPRALMLGFGIAGGFFIFGFVIGISPCPPLMGLLLEIAFVSKTFLQGAIYGLMFGLGTFLSGFIIAAGLSGILILSPKKIAMPIAATTIFRSVSAVVLILFGIVFILSAKR